MEVILMHDLMHTGKRGDVIDVKPGFARNYLIPQGLALEATAGNRKLYEQQRERIEEQHEQERQAAEEMAARLEGVEITLLKLATDEENLYGSVTATEIADALEEQGVEIDKRHIDLEGGIKSTGDHPVRIELYTDVAAEILVHVVAEE